MRSPNRWPPSTTCAPIARWRCSKPCAPKTESHGSREGPAPRTAADTAAARGARAVTPARTETSNEPERHDAGAMAPGGNLGRHGGPAPSRGRDRDRHRREPGRLPAGQPPARGRRALARTGARLRDARGPRGLRDRGPDLRAAVRAQARGGGRRRGRSALARGGAGRTGRRARRTRRDERPAARRAARAPGAGPARPVRQPPPAHPRRRRRSRLVIDAALLNQILVATGMGLVGAVVFAAIGLVSGTDETTTLAPLTLLVVLLGVPPAGVFTFFLAAAVAKHMTHAVPTALLGIPGDTMATPLLQDANMLRNLGVPHIALRKMVSGAIIAAFVAVPLAVLFAVLLAPYGAAITKAAP
ncbi:conserved hypothetical protein [Ricinus communis]|uniref:DUF112 domain-containing protein n=1 Tax=Ricinus communis TaxID=3988 RepID=B9THM3_RICCO|nr:conserved hypothetical protein [Ricinus communis]